MPVFNIAANTQRNDPVGAMYEGKAVRLALKNKDLANQALQQEIDANLPERKMGAVEDRNEILRDQEDRLQDKAEQDVQAQTAEIGINAAMAGYDAYHATEGDEAAKKLAGYNGVVSVIDNMVPGGKDAALEWIKENQGREYVPEEFDVNEARALIAPLMKKGKEGDSEFERLIENMPPEMQERLRRQRAEKLSSWAPKENKPTYDPPNKAELEAAKKIISIEFPDLDGRFTKIAQMWLASEIRNIQERESESYDVALAMAVAGLKTKIKKEPDFLSGEDDALDLSGTALSDGEYLVDGVTYVEDETAEDGFRRKN